MIEKCIVKKGWQCIEDWQPMDTPPKDETLVLLYVPRARIHCYVVGLKSKNSKYWHDRNHRHIIPTKWMPILPPKE